MSVTDDDMVTVLGIIARMDKEQKDEAWTALQNRSQTIRKAALKSFRAGDIVEFDSNRSVIRGEVVASRGKVNVKVRETHRDERESTPDCVTWRVAATLLRLYDNPSAGGLRLPEASE